jgi:hypothetical protein
MVHSNVDSGSLEENSNVGVLVIVDPAAGPASIVVCGAVVSTVNVRVAGDASVFPTPSVAVTVSVCSPSARGVGVYGESHENVPPPSIAHSNVEPGSLEENSNVGVVSVIVAPAAGPASIVVCGAVVSTVNVRVAGDASALPAPSDAVTVSVC